MWDVCDDGVFVGGFGSGKGLHMDQCLWANVGANWRGFKLVATWRAGADSKRMVDDFLDVVFSPGLMDARRTEALLSAHRVVLLRPGDCFVSSGGVAHATLVVKGLNLTSYESLVTLHPRLVDHFLSSTDPKLRGSRQAADEDMIDGITRTMARRLEAVSRDPKPGECSYRCAQALRTHYADTVSLLASRGEALDTTVLRAAATFRRAQQEDRKRRKRGRPG